MCHAKFISSPIRFLTIRMNQGRLSGLQTSTMSSRVLICNSETLVFRLKYNNNSIHTNLNHNIGCDQDYALGCLAENNNRKKGFSLVSMLIWVSECGLN